MPGTNEGAVALSPADDLELLTLLLTQPDDPVLLLIALPNVVFAPKPELVGPPAKVATPGPADVEFPNNASAKGSPVPVPLIVIPPAPKTGVAELRCTSAGATGVRLGIAVPTLFDGTGGANPFCCRGGLFTFALFAAPFPCVEFLGDEEGFEPLPLIEVAIPIARMCSSFRFFNNKFLRRVSEAEASPPMDNNSIRITIKREKNKIVVFCVYLQKQRNCYNEREPKTHHQFQSVEQSLSCWAPDWQTDPFLGHSY